jgi:hypothetical protein
MRHLRIAIVYSCLIISCAFVQAQEAAAPNHVRDIGSYLNVRPVPVWQSNYAVYPYQRLSGTLWFTFNGTSNELNIDSDLLDIPAKINAARDALPSDWKVAIKVRSDGMWLTIEPKDPSSFFSQVSIGSKSSLTDQNKKVITFERKYSAFFPQKHDEDIKILRSINGAPIDLQKDFWVFHYYDAPIVTVTIDKGDAACDDVKRAVNPYATACAQQYLLARNDEGTVVTVMEVTDRGLKINGDALKKDLHYAVNGALPLDPDNGPFLVPLSDGDLWHVDWFKTPAGCRSYNINKEEHDRIELYEPNPTGETRLVGIKSNYITVGNAKIFDVALLQQMLNGTATQLAALSGFSAASITGAFGNLQGVARDTSSLSAQVTTTPLPTVATTNTAGQRGSSQLVTGSTGPGASSTIVTLQCPNGSLPTLGSNSTEGCAVPTAPAGTTIIVPGTSTGTITTNGTTNPGSTTQQTTGNQTTQQNGTTTTTGGFAGTVPTAPASTAFSAPNNVGVSSADILTEQVELNAQITTLRLLLQGALSDQYVIRHSRPVATRKQTTLGFTITLDPPRQFRHAVAEVRVLVVPPPGPDGVSIVNLLPAEKTYNVAKITSHQNSFGAGVAVAPVSVGVNASKSKDRLYLAKDTDTLALQYIPPVPLGLSEKGKKSAPGDESEKRKKYAALKEIDRPFPQNAHDKYKGLINLMGPNELGDCDVPGQEGEPGFDPDATGHHLVIGPNATVFGWQFRPVLGAEYVRGGQRQVFAQLAMPPTATSQTPSPKLYIQTRWRAYDPKRQVVGAVYTSSCSSVPDLSGIADMPIISVKNVDMSDLGGGQIKLTSTGQFDTASISVLAGTTNIVPLTSDGETLQLFGNAHDLLAADQLNILGPSGTRTPFGRGTKTKGCGIDGATLDAVPYPDGNSRMTLKLTLGPNYLLDPSADGPPMPLVLIGSQVYGLRKTPFLAASCDQTHPSACTYKFIAPTTDARNAQSFLVKDLRWTGMSKQGTTSFSPLFSSLAAVAAPPTSPSSPCAQKVKCPPDPPDPTKPKPTTTLLVSGFDFDKLAGYGPPCRSSPTRPCLSIVLGGGVQAEMAGKPKAKRDKKTESESIKPIFTPVTRNLATLDVDKGSLANSKVVRFQLNGQEKPDEIGEYRVEWDLPVPKSDKAASITATPAFLRVSDSRAVTFQGDKISSVDETSVMFDSTAPPIKAKLSADPTTPDSMILTVYVTTAVTKTPGHKELTVNIKGSSPAQTLQLPIDVFK